MPNFPLYWQEMQSLPGFFAIALICLIFSIWFLLYVLPCIFMIIREPKGIKRWWNSQADVFQQLNGDASKMDKQLFTLKRGLDSVNESVGRVVAWLALFMVFTQFTVVIMRYIYSYGSIPMQEAIWYMHGTLFMLALGYTFLQDGHVRLDVFYREFSNKRKAWVNLLGCVFFLIPLCFFTFELAWPLVSNAWRIKEGSTEVSGLPYIYLLKSVILVAFSLLLIQAIAVIITSILELRGRVLSLPVAREDF